MTGRRERRGFALIAVLWVVVVLGVLGVELQAAGLFSRNATANARAATRARWAARAGLARAMEMLDRRIAGNLAGFDLAAAGDSALPAMQLDVDGTSVRVVTLDARARLNLNRAGHHELERLFDAAGLGTRAADSLADAVLDWRDADDLRRGRGAEGADYRTLRPAARPKDAPFDAVEELATVWGMTAERYRRVAPYLTVAGDGRVNVNSASAAVLRTLPEIDEGAAVAIVRRRVRAPIRNIFELLAVVPLPVRTRMKARMGEMTDRISFFPREIEVVALATAPGAPVGAELHGTILLSGASNVALVSVTERLK
ncbi:MAG TPA: type II secretion system protein GspK [Gemmatimonadaceae bacterium]|nr:type II secretion system protein GspK [Gemmatimonadaceae bacterium]